EEIVWAKPSTMVEGAAIAMGHLKSGQFREWRNPHVERDPVSGPRSIRGAPWQLDRLPVIGH
ncbi:MAG: hypothetical protein ACM3YM_03730, partial [Sphingomonadales bacterium]